MKLIDRLQQLDHEYQQLRRQLAMGLIEGIVLTPVKKKKKDAPKSSTAKDSQ